LDDVIFCDCDHSVTKRDDYVNGRVSHLVPFRGRV
jgi:hypothetical protein